MGAPVTTISRLLWMRGFGIMDMLRTSGDTPRRITRRRGKSTMSTEGSEARVSTKALDGVLGGLEDLLGDRFSTATAVLDHHGRDESWHAPTLPHGVCFPEHRDEVVEIVRRCGEAGVPIVPFGAGSSVEGQVLPIAGGVSLDLSRMDRILAVHPDDLDAVVQPGVTRLRLDRHLRDEGLFFPIDPGADASIGGMTATRASGTTAVRYGTMRENVLALEVVLASGEVIRTGRRARKSSAGYDLTRLFVGSEGTLGVFTEITLRVQGLPEAMVAAVVGFEEVRPAVETAIQIIQAGIPVARVELLDEVMLRAVNAYAKTDYPVRPTLFLELHGSPAVVEEQAGEIGEVAKVNGGLGFRWEKDAEAREKLWHARHHAYYAALDLRPGARVLSTDVCVPISRLADCIEETQRDLETSSFEATPLVGHVGDGNFHLLLLVDRDSPEEAEEASRLHDRLVHRALSMEGTSTGEHGVGLGKRRFLVPEHGEAAVATMRTLKTALDPNGLFNPGKVL